MVGRLKNYQVFKSVFCFQEFGVGLARWKADSVGQLHNQQGARHPPPVQLGYDLCLRPLGQLCSLWRPWQHLFDIQVCHCILGVIYIDYAREEGIILLCISRVWNLKFFLHLGLVGRREWYAGMWCRCLSIYNSDSLLSLGTSTKGVTTAAVFLTIYHALVIPVVGVPAGS